MTTAINGHRHEHAVEDLGSRHASSASVALDIGEGRGALIIYPSERYRGTEIEKALQQKFDEAVAKKAPLLEIIPGKGSGQLKKHVLRFLEQKRSSAKNMRVEKPSKNFGTIKVHFNWNEPGRR